MRTIEGIKDQSAYADRGSCTKQFANLTFDLGNELQSRSLAKTKLTLFSLETHVTPIWIVS